jgi:hypothetical protein
MAQYAVLIYGEESTHATANSSQDAEAHRQYADELVRSGSMVTAYALTPPDMATSIREDSITDGPFLETKEIVAGFYVIDASDLDAALAIARRNPIVQQGGGVEVRPVFGAYVRDQEQPVS